MGVNKEAQGRQHHRREDDAERGPRLLPARRQSRKLLLNDPKLGFDRSEIRAHLIRLPQHEDLYVWHGTRYASINGINDNTQRMSTPTT